MNRIAQEQQKYNLQTPNEDHDWASTLALLDEVAQFSEHEAARLAALRAGPPEGYGYQEFEDGQRAQERRRAEDRLVWRRA